MKNLALIASFVFFFSLSAATQTVRYKLSGDYIFQISRAQISSWSASSACIDQNGKLHTATGGGSITYTSAIYGTLTFDAGKVTAQATQASYFDSAASDKTVEITWSADCVPSVDNGSAVFDPPTPLPLSGTYSIHAKDGTGGINFTTGYALSFQTAGVCSACIVGANITIVPATMMLRAWSSKRNNVVNYTGTAEHIFTGRNVPCLQEGP